MKEEALVRQFEHNNGEYVKITRAVVEKARAILSDRKKLLEFASLSLIESIRENRTKYSSLIPHDMSSTTDFTSSHYNSVYMYMYGQQQPPQQPIQPRVYFAEDYVAMLSQDADKLMEKLEKELQDEILSDYPVSTSLQPSLPGIE